MPKGVPLSNEHKAKIKASMVGLKNGGQFKKGCKPWCAGTKGLVRNKLKGKKMPEEWRAKLCKPKSVKVVWTEERRANHFKNVPRREKHPLWKGGITPYYETLRNQADYRNWRFSVFERDSFTCTECGDNKGGNLQAHHIKPFSTHPELRYAIDNGITLCLTCHRKTDSYAGRQTYKNRLTIDKHGI